MKLLKRKVKNFRHRTLLMGKGKCDRSWGGRESGRQVKLEAEIEVYRYKFLSDIDSTMKEKSARLIPRLLVLYNFCLIPFSDMTLLPFLFCTIYECLFLTFTWSMQFRFKPVNGIKLNRPGYWVQFLNKLLSNHSNEKIY